MVANVPMPTVARPMVNSLPAGDNAWTSLNPMVVSVMKVM